MQTVERPHTMKKLTELTPAQHDRMSSFAQEWILRGWRTTPLTESEWQVWEAGARKCYEYAGIPWPGVVVRVSSPIVGAVAAPAAAYSITLHRILRRDAVDDAVGGAVGGAVDGAVGGAVDGAVHGAVRDAVRAAVDDAVRAAVDGAVRAAVDGAVRGAVHAAVHGAVDAAVDGAVDGAVRAAVRGAVDGAVDDAVRKTIDNLRYSRFGGTIWAGYWNAYLAFFRDVVELKIKDELWDRSRAFEDAQSAGWWFPFKDFVMVCDVPREIHVEQIGPTGWGSHRLHCETGPAVSWADGWGVYSWHGTLVPEWVIENPTVEQALKERNSEVRRAAFEAVGWDKAITELGINPIDTCPDPGNSPHHLSLYALPEQIYDQPVNLLLMVNGSPDRNGELRRYGETVPASITKADAAAAWQYGVPTNVYRQLARRT
jgi:hypothetical protein